MKTHYDFTATVHDSFQDIFDYVAEKLMEQGEKAFNFESETCQYRQEHTTGTVLKCAVGWLIPDEVYKTHFENDALQDVLEFLGEKTTTAEKVANKRFKFLQNLQRCHDDAGDTSFRNDLFDHMTELANIYNLKTDHLDYFANKYVQSNSV